VCELGRGDGKWKDLERLHDPDSFSILPIIFQHLRADLPNHSCPPLFAPCQDGDVSVLRPRGGRTPDEGGRASRGVAKRKV
jgi:hypothetical protein